MRVVATLLSYPPARFIGSELMTHRLLVALRKRGHEVSAFIQQPNRGFAWKYEGVKVMQVDLMPEYVKHADVVLCHADYSMYARELRDRHGAFVVSVCHNLEWQVLQGLSDTGPDLTVVNAQWAADELGYGLVVRPPLDLPAEVPPPGDRVTMVNLNENKGGPMLWDLALLMPDTQFMGIRGGYGPQFVPPIKYRARNVKVYEHVRAEHMAEQVWAKSRVLLVPSQRETWGSTASEAMAHGVPVIASPTPGLLENLGDAGLFVERTNKAGYIAAITKLRDPNFYDSVVEAGLARARVQAAQWNADLTRFCESLEASCGAAFAG